jgi:hypothetical protein
VCLSLPLLQSVRERFGCFKVYITYLIHNMHAWSRMTDLCGDLWMITIHLEPKREIVKKSQLLMLYIG